VDGHYPPEIQPLATELNFLIDHNRDVVERARTHVGNLAHALKTPLAVLVNESQSRKSRKDAEFSNIVERQTTAMRSQVDHHLRRARAAARGQAIGVSTDVEPVLSALARTLADYATALKRGARLDEATPGTGFGLAIVDDLARAYKGSVKLSRSDLGGLCVTLILPMITARSQGMT